VVQIPQSTKLILVRLEYFVIGKIIDRKIEIIKIRVRGNEMSSERSAEQPLVQLATGNRI
jgi:hypothetical protein